MSHVDTHCTNKQWCHVHITKNVNSEKFAQLNKIEFDWKL